MCTAAEGVESLASLALACLAASPQTAAPFVLAGGVGLYLGLGTCLAALAFAEGKHQFRKRHPLAIDALVADKGQERCAAPHMCSCRILAGLLQDRALLPHTEALDCGHACRGPGEGVVGLREQRRRRRRRRCECGSTHCCVCCAASFLSLTM